MVSHTKSKRVLFKDLESLLAWPYQISCIMYWSCNRKSMLNCSDENPTSSPEAWVQMEYACSPVDLRSVLCAATPPLLNQFRFNPVVYHSIRIWFQFKRHFNLQTTSIFSLIKNIITSHPPLQTIPLGYGTQKVLNISLICMLMASLDHLLSFPSYLIYLMLTSSGTYKLDILSRKVVPPSLISQQIIQLVTSFLYPHTANISFPSCIAV